MAKKKKQETLGDIADPPPKQKSEYEHRFECDFGGFACAGKTTARLAVTIQKKDLTPTLAEKLFASKRARVRIDERIDNELPNASAEKKPILATVDFKGYGSRTDWTTAMTFALSEIDSDEIIKLAGRQGTLELTVLGAAVAQSDNSTADPDEEAQRLRNAPLARRQTRSRCEVYAQRGGPGAIG